MFSIQPFKDAGLYRELKNIRQHSPYLTWEGSQYLNLSSNDYLGISARIDWQREFLSSHLDDREFLSSSLSSRLLTGNSPAFAELEDYLAALYGRPACLLFNSGYHANLGILPALCGKKDLILADKLVHASLIDGLRLCEGKWLRFRHNDYDDLTRLLEKHHKDYERIFIVTESVFSMDGDRADLHKLIEIKKQYNALLYLDEAHGVGVFGSKGLGWAEEQNCLPDIDLHMCTLGKALASEGAFLVCGKDVKEYLVNTCRSLIFTTAIPPLQIKWTRFIFEKAITMSEERRHLHSLTTQFRNALEEKHLLGDSQIAPYLVGDSTQCTELTERLKNAGIWTMAVRYPTVPINQARIRFSLTAAFTHSQIDTICERILAY